MINDIVEELDHAHEYDQDPWDATIYVRASKEIKELREKLKAHEHCVSYQEINDLKSKNAWEWEKDELERLRAENITLKQAVGEEGRANRMTLLYETAQGEIEWLKSQVRMANLSMKKLFKIAEREPQDGESREVGLAREISRLRVQIGELLPWAQSEVSDIVHNAADGRSTYIVKAAAELLARIENGEFGDVS